MPSQQIPPGAGEDQVVRLRVNGPSVQDRLASLRDLFADRGASYGQSWHEVGAILSALFPRGLVLSEPEDFGRYFLVNMLTHKLQRYALNFNRGGHDDSLNDMSVYAQMLAELDETINLNKKGE